MNFINFKNRIKEITKHIKKFNFLNLILSKIFFYRLRTSNFFLANYEYNKKREFTHSYPLKVTLNTSNICNYQCIFCESSYFYEFARKNIGKIFPNHVNIDFIKKFDRLFSKIIYIDFTSGSGEPLLNPYFIDVCKYLKKKNVNLIVTTNGSLIDKSMAENLVDLQFNHIAISMHSGEENNYRELMGGDFKKVLKNIEYIIAVKNKKGVDLPKISINCLISTLNQHTIKNLINEIKEFGIQLNLYHYYASRNKTRGDVSFYKNPEAGNKFLKEIYQYAKSINFKSLPKKPPYITNKNKEEPSLKNICTMPWKNLVFEGSVEFEDSHYISVCGRIVLFRLNFKEFDADFHKDIWNHELIRYFRKSIMKNHICQFCQNPHVQELRCLNNKKYQIDRDIAIQKFFSNAFKTIKIKDRKGIYLLKEYPYKYKDYYERT